MSRSQADKAAIHEEIVHLAAERFREVGLNGIGVAELMKAAGRTSGGFYKHFESREKLVEEVLASVFEKRTEALKAYVDSATPRSLGDLVDSYLSQRHKDAPGSGCALAALMNDVARSSEPIRALYTEEVRSELAMLTRLMNHPEARAQALLTMCTLAGAIGLARAVQDEALAAEILDTGKTLLKMLEA
ncbi:TetR family transcriptional regulator [Pseudomonas sp. Pseusp122]|uniref:TetR/AcrR family transcriptional regulator n=1 Tax=unclassified Pseudomonas TaxID=196821 RepID=UPI0039A5A7AA